ncbi:hypothetical protein HBI56_056020 [Parastagonospora nodorum]|nr:hypothetical protein HBH56_096090 [Parastagonospora nodorum]KAH3930215.1 hypothetical protein HBH54_110410 [Parastagonospora nodorum]KAH3945031.1 hypothetical protein HBH53_149030 [Parastagonospora nodorum]KAH4002964.1 hypothetical protein HBI10_069000 [Parastagonospora nodorum]KAH4026954.1 hypothetical protein HBI09_146250 [Parastagonospora nodorum]
MRAAAGGRGPSLCVPSCAFVASKKSTRTVSFTLSIAQLPLACYLSPTRNHKGSLCQRNTPISRLQAAQELNYGQVFNQRHLGA